MSQSVRELLAQGGRGFFLVEVSCGAARTTDSWPCRVSGARRQRTSLERRVARTHASAASNAHDRVRRYDILIHIHGDTPELYAAPTYWHAHICCWLSDVPGLSIPQSFYKSPRAHRTDPLLLAFGHRHRRSALLLRAIELYEQIDSTLPRPMLSPSDPRARSVLSFDRSSSLDREPYRATGPTAVGRHRRR